MVIQDLPGIYSLSPYTLEEVVARGYLVNEKPDAILNIVDGTNIERNLYLTTQLIELGIPVVVAVNMIDLVRKNGDKIDLKKLGEALGCDVVEMSALKNEGGMEAAQRCVRAAQSAKGKAEEELPHVFTGSVEHAIAHIEESIAGRVDARNLRWYAIKVFERDEKVLAELNLDASLKKHLEEHIQDCEKELDDDAESIITNQRYAYINKVVEKAVKKKAALHSLSTSDKIDKIVTNRILALPIFALVMVVVYWIAMGPFGTFLTDWTNDVLGGAWLTEGSRSLLESWGTADWLTGLVSDGIVAGVGAVLGFVPQMLVLFLMLSILEDIGYMARVAFIMDRIFRKFGLSGKSFIPMLIGSGCGVPGVMASRTIENERDRRMTIMTTTFVPCGRQDAHCGPVRRGAVRRQRLGGCIRLLHRHRGHHPLGHHPEKDQDVRRGSGSLRYGAARLSCARRRQRAPGHLGARLVLHQAGRYHHSGLLRYFVVPAGLRLCGWPVRHGGGQQHFHPGGHWQRHLRDLRAPGLWGLAVHGGGVHRPDCQGKRGLHLWRAVWCGH